MTEDQIPFRGYNDPDFAASRLLTEPATKADLVAAVFALRGDIEALRERLVTWLCAVLIALIAGIALIAIRLQT